MDFNAFSSIPSLLFDHDLIIPHSDQTVGKLGRDEMDVGVTAGQWAVGLGVADPPDPLRVHYGPLWIPVTSKWVRTIRSGPGYGIAFLGAFLCSCEHLDYLQLTLSIVRV